MQEYNLTSLQVVSFVVVWQGAQVYSSPILVLFDVINQLTGVFLLLTFLSKKNHRNRTSSTVAPHCTLIKKKIKFSSYLRKFRMEQLQSHI
jgi:hypothetical protein